MPPDTDICYLCGQPLRGEISRDHVPPKQFYATNLRREYGPNLFTLPVHAACNKSFQKDEDYFVHSIGPLAMESYTGKALWKDISDRCERPQNMRVAQMVLKEFDERPSGIILPPGRVAKRYDGTRVWRVVWKIIRGLFFIEMDQVLPEDLPRRCMMLSPGESSPIEFNIVLAEPSRGKYPLVFDYKYIGKPKKVNLWAICFWDRIIVFVGFHAPGCICKVCVQDKKKG